MTFANDEEKVKNLLFSETEPNPFDERKGTQTRCSVVEFSHCYE